MIQRNDHYVVIHWSTAEQLPVRWLVLSERGGVLEQGSLNELQQLATQVPQCLDSRVYLLVSAAEVGLHRVHLPGKHNAAALQALPYLLEEQLASQVEQLHIARLARAGEDIFLATVERELIERWITPLREQGIQLQAIIPDVLLLPLHDDGATAILLEQHWLIRTGPYQGMAADPTWLGELCQAWQHEFATPLRVYSMSLPPASLPQWQPLAPEADPLLLLARQAPTSNVSLLQGDYASQRASNPTLRQWRAPLVALVVMLALFVTQHAITYWQLSQQADALQAQVMKQYRQQFPDAPQAAPSRQLLRRQLQTPQSTGATRSLLDWLAPLPSLLEGVKPLDITSLQYQRQELRLGVHSDNFQTLEQLRERAAQYYQVLPQPMTERAGKVKTLLLFKERQQ